MAATAWNWDALDAELRPRFLHAGVARFGLTRDEAEDVYQAVLLNVISLDPRVNDPVPYLKRCFRNTALNRLRSPGRTTSEVSTGDLPGPPPPSLTPSEIGRMLWRAFQRTDPLCSQIIRGYYLSRRSLAETASESGYSPKTIWRKIQRCLARMRQCLT